MTSSEKNTEHLSSENLNRDDADLLDQLHLTIDSHVVVQLGAELVSDAEQALLELVKNAYDADSAYCTVEVDTAYNEEINLISSEDHERENPRSDQGGLEPERKHVLSGLIRVTDGGDGMTLEQIQHGWLVISASQKRPHGSGKKQPTQKYSRIPLGDKGLGRLSTMRLGDKLTIRTFTAADSEGIELSFRWSSFTQGVPIEGVTLEKRRIPKEKGRAHGTTIEIAGLNEISHWKDANRRHTLRTNLSALVSPFENKDSFSIKLLYDGDPDSIEKLSEQQLQRAAATFSASWEPHEIQTKAAIANEVIPKSLVLAAKLRMGLFVGNSKKSQELYSKYILADKGARLFEYFKIHKETRGYVLERSDLNGEISYSEVLTQGDIPAEREFAFWADPGPFEAKMYYYMLNSELDAAAVAGAKSVISKEQIKAMAGVSVFRDGFKVRFGDDWLRLSHGTTSGGSFYGLRPQNTIGYFNITGENNHKLVEKSDREGFVDNPQFRGFMTLARRAVKFSNDILEHLRRATNDFLKDQEAISKPDEKFSPEHGVEKLREAAERVAASQQRLDTLTMSILNRFEKLKEKTDVVRNDLLIDENVDNHLTQVNREIEIFQNDLNVARQEIKKSTQQLSGDIAFANEVSSRFDALHEQIQKLYESAAVGLSARGLVHDASVFIDEIFGAVKAIRAALQSNGETGDEIRQQIGKIQTAAKGIANYLALIDPMLPAQRMQREKINIGTFVSSYFEVRKSQFDEQNIKIVLANVDAAPTVRINRGRLLQVLDNLVRNSQYWVLVAGKHQLALERKICVDFSPKGFTLSDSGRGVREALENSLFELFVTDKPGGEASGMGLFITKTLLELERCGIELLPERNASGRRFKFLVDLSNVRA